MSYHEEPIKRAKTRFLDLSHPRPSFTDLAAEFGIDESDIYLISIRDNWLPERRRLEKEERERIQKVEATLVSVDAPSETDELSQLRKRLHETDVDLIDSRTWAVVEYLDELLANGALKGKDAITYLKLLTDISARIQKTVDDVKGEVGDREKVVTEFLHSLRAKADTIRALRQEKPAQAAIEKRRSIMRELDAPES